MNQRLYSSYKVSQVFTRVTEKKKLLSLANKIKLYSPHSNTIYNELLMHSRGISPMNSFFTLNSSQESHALVCKTEGRTLACTLFCPEEEQDSLIKAIYDTHLLDWTKHIGEIIVPDYLFNDTLEMMGRVGITPTIYDCCSITYFPHQDFEPLKCSAGYRVCRLGKAGVRQLLDSSTYNKCDSLDDVVQLAESMPFIGVYLDPSITQDSLVDLDNISIAGDEDLPVSWVGTTIRGTLGMLSTAKEYKRRGLGELLVRVATRLQDKQGFIPFAYVDASNRTSLILHNKLQGWTFTNFTKIIGS